MCALLFDVQVVEYWMDWISLLFPDHIAVYYPTAKNSQTPYAIFDGHRPGSRRTGGSARMDVVFYSDQMGTDLGFKLRFKAVPAIVRKLASYHPYLCVYVEQWLAWWTFTRVII